MRISLVRHMGICRDKVEFRKDLEEEFSCSVQETSKRKTIYSHENFFQEVQETWTWTKHTRTDTFVYVEKLKFKTGSDGRTIKFKSIFQEKSVEKSIIYILDSTTAYILILLAGGK